MDGIIEAISSFASAEPAIYYLIIGIIGAVVLSAVVNIGAMYVIWLEVKLLGDFSARYGPNRVGGRWGLLQIVADAIKLFTKEDSIPASADKPVYVWAPIVASMATMLVAAAIPFGALHINGKDYPLVVANMDISAFYVEAALSLLVIAAFMASPGSYRQGLLPGGGTAGGFAPAGSLQTRRTCSRARRPHRHPDGTGD